MELTAIIVIIIMACTIVAAMVGIRAEMIAEYDRMISDHKEKVRKLNADFNEKMHDLYVNGLH